MALCVQLVNYFLDPRKASKIGVSVNPDAENLGKLKGKHYNRNFPFSIIFVVNLEFLFFYSDNQLLYLGILREFYFGNIFFIMCKYLPKGCVSKLARAHQLASAAYRVQKRILLKIKNGQNRERVANTLYISFQPGIYRENPRDTG